VLIDQFDEPFVVGRFQQMHQFMDNDVFQTLPWLFGKVGVQKDGLVGGVATPSAPLQQSKFGKAKPFPK
jgi:hypothetical protein